MYAKPENESRQFWDMLASNYDDHQSNDNYLKLIGRIVHDVGQRENVLDLGCGTGLVALALAMNVGRIEAVDYSPKMIEVAREKSVKNDIKNINFSVCNAGALSFPDGHFDAVVVCNSLHVMEKPEKALLESKRVLKKDGLLVAPNACLDATEETKRQSEEMIARGFPSYHLFTADSYCEMLENIGFRVTAREPVDYRMPMEYVTARKG